MVCQCFSLIVACSYFAHLLLTSSPYRYKNVVYDISFLSFLSFKLTSSLLFLKHLSSTAKTLHGRKIFIWLAWDISASIYIQACTTAQFVANWWQIRSDKAQFKHCPSIVNEAKLTEAKLKQGHTKRPDISSNWGNWHLHAISATNICSDCQRYTICLIGNGINARIWKRICLFLYSSEWNQLPHWPGQVYTLQ